MNDGIALYQVDVFTDRPFTGNQAAVYILDAPREPDWMRVVAREMNLPATAFVAPRGAEFDLRWFTAVTELTLCGHGTLATPHVPSESRRLAPEALARFQTPSGLLTARRAADWIELDFPSEPPEEAPAPGVLSKALGIEPKFVGRNRLDYLVELESEAAVRALAPDLPLLKTIATRGVIV